jgi:hypothetical protein
MGRILTRDNLEAYMKWKDKPWGVADLLYERVPMLTVRNYIASANDDNWPLCWSRGYGLQRGLALCIDFLRNWKAFRPGSAESYRQVMEAVVPLAVLRFQRRVVGELGASGAIDVCQDVGKSEALGCMMTEAVEKVSDIKELKQPTPMLGSKVMHFFFPEFFPIWDTAVVKKALVGLRRLSEVHDEGESPDRKRERDGVAGREYRAYVRLMLKDLREAKGDVQELDGMLIKEAVRTYQDRFLRDLLYENLGDRSPILFELCTIGYGRRKGLFR